MTLRCNAFFDRRCFAYVRCHCVASLGGARANEPFRAGIVRHLPFGERRLAMHLPGVPPAFPFILRAEALRGTAALPVRVSRRWEAGCAIAALRAATILFVPISPRTVRIRGNI